MMISKNDLEEWLKSGGTNYPMVSKEDVGKVAKITDVDLVDTRFGRRLKVELAFNKGDTIKVIFLSKTKAKVLADTWGVDPQGWIGKNVQVTTVNIIAGGKMKETLTIAPTIVQDT